MADIAPQPSGEPVPIHVQRCGQARVTLVDQDGLPLPNVGVKLMVCMRDDNVPGGKTRPVDRSNARLQGIGAPPPEAVTDRQGKIVFAGLIPDATYQLVNHNEKELIGEEFQVAPGQQLEMRIVLGKR
jgi:hypothetical protein